MLPVGVALLDVVVANDIDHGGDSAPATAVGHRGAPGRIETPGERLHRGGDARALDVAFDGPFLVAERPEDDTGMVAVAPDHALELAHLLGARSHQAVLVEDEQAEAVTRFQQFRVRGIMGAAHGVGAKILQAGNAKCLQSVRQGHADAGEILVGVGALEFDAAAVEEETLVGVEPNRADAERGFIAVFNGAGRADRRDQLVQGR